MSTPDLTPPGPPIVPSAAPMPAPANPYGQATPPMPWGYGVPLPAAPRRAPRGLAVAVIVLSILLWLVELLQAATAGTIASNPDAFLPAYDLLSLPFWPLAIACYIVTCLWLQSSRSFSDTHRQGVIHETHPLWTWLGWLVPVAALVMPARVVTDVYRNSRPHGAGVGLVGLWWWTWPAWQFTSFVAVRMRMDRSSNFQTAEVIGALLITASLAGWLLIIRRVDQGQQQEFSRQVYSARA